MSRPKFLRIRLTMRSYNSILENFFEDFKMFNAID